MSYCTNCFWIDWVHKYTKIKGLDSRETTSYCTESKTWWTWCVISIIAENKPHTHHKVRLHIMKVYNNRPVNITIEVFSLRFFFFLISEIFTSSKVISAFKRQNSWTDPSRKSSTPFALVFPKREYLSFLSFLHKHTWLRSRRDSYPQFPRSPLGTPANMTTLLASTHETLAFWESRC